MLQPQTLNRKAFEYYNSATVKTAKYSKTLDLSVLDQALEDLDKSIQADAGYFQPANYKGIVYDMKGQSIQAIQQFDSIYDHVPESLRAEVDYNRAIANYHLYHEPNIRQAIESLEKLIGNSSGNLKLNVLSKSALAQSYGMMVHHSLWKDETLVMRYYKLANDKADEVINSLSDSKKTLGEQFLKHATWIAYNAKGTSRMFRDDLMRDKITKENEKSYTTNLKDALAFFNKAVTYSPNNWALKCNQGSVHMRLGHLFTVVGNIVEAKKHFKEAETALFEVITKLRPNYDFALYELGRIYRFQKLKEKALEYFSKAKNTDDGNRNISVASIDKNIALAEKDITSFATY